MFIINLVLSCNIDKVHVMVLLYQDGITVSMRITHEWKKMLHDALWRFLKMGGSPESSHKNQSLI